MKAGQRALFVVTILTGSFLLFLVQPLVARMALPRLGGAPNVWNSAMLVYQALLLAGYFYAHRLARQPLKRQVRIHLGLLLLAGLSLPITLAQLPAPAPGSEVFWVPALLALTIGPVFFVVSAQAPLMQRWYSLDPGAGQPWALYAASNLGSFAGLIAYPLLAEPLLSIRAQSWGWSLGYVLLVALVAMAARARWSAPDAPRQREAAGTDRVPLRTVLLWLALAAVPSGLMLSTTTHLTTDLVAMPLLWVIPLGLYLLSFVIAFSDRRGLAEFLSGMAWIGVLTAGGIAMTSQGTGSLLPAIASVVLLFLVCVALHARLYDLRPGADQLTFFYLVMSAGGVVGGGFTALVAPLVFDWAWEHPLLVLAAAALLPAVPALDWRRMRGLDPAMARIGNLALLGAAAFLIWRLTEANRLAETNWISLGLAGGIVVIGLALTPWRWQVVPVLLATMLAQGGIQTIEDSLAGLRTRSYFGIYTVRDYPERKLRNLAHGTTLHGQQSTDPALRRLPLTYYGMGSGAGIAMSGAPRLFGPAARIGVVGLGTGSLACYRRPGQAWTFFEIDPAVLDYSRKGTFTYVNDCAPDAGVVLGDARLELAKVAPGSFDLIAVDAFSSDAIPIHLLTREALGVYERALSPKGILLIHISNRFVELEPVLAAIARQRGLVARLRDDVPEGKDAELFTASSWVAIGRDPAQMKALEASAPGLEWLELQPPAPRVWSDDHASILPFVRWHNFVGSP